MSITINGNGTITGYEPVANGSITTAKLADGAATQAKRTYATGEIIQVKYKKSADGQHSSASAGGNGADVSGYTDSISLTSSSNNTLIILSLNPYLGGSSDVRYALKLFRDTTMIYEDTWLAARSGESKAFRSSHIFLDTGVSDTNSHTYKVALKKESGSDSIYLMDEGLNAHTMTLMEIAA